MNLALALVAAVAAVNPFRVGPALPDRDRTPIAGIGGLAALAALVAVALASGPMLDGLQVSVPTSRIAAGIAVGLGGARSMLIGPPDPEPALVGRAAALVPLAFPVLLEPGLALLVLALAADRGVATASAVAAVALAVGLGVGLVLAGGRGNGPGSTGAVHRTVGAVAMAAGVAVTLGGILAV